MQAIPWPLRPLLFAAIGGLTALAVYYLIDDLQAGDEAFTLRTTAAIAITTFSLVLALVSRRDRLPSATLFALITAGVVAGICYWRIHIDWPHPFNFLSLALALFIAAPFYQSAVGSSGASTGDNTGHPAGDANQRNQKPLHANAVQVDARRRKALKYDALQYNALQYKALHYNAWSNAVTIPLGLLFVALTFAMAYLLAELFSLVGVDQLKQILEKDLPPWLIGGTALGAALGTLREHDTIIASTQRLVQSVFSLLTSPLALGLGGFLLILPFTGLDTLWNNTDNTTATLFSCALAALVFLNTVVREDSINQSNNRIMQLAARVLAISLAPLALITALAIKLRVEQYGWTPDRLWATVIGSLLLVYGLLYLLSALRRQQFNESIRQSNLTLALLVCALALLLATPLFDFGKVSLNDQMARFKDGRVSEDNLDVVSMAFDFGPAGRAALLDLRNTASPSLASRIDNILAADSRRAAQFLDTEAEADITVTVMNGSGTVPEELRHAIQLSEGCGADYCYLFWSAGGQEAIVLDQICSSHTPTPCQPNVQRYTTNGSQWFHHYHNNRYDRLYETLHPADRPASLSVFIKALDNAARQGLLELRPVQRQQLFIDGIPVGPTLP